MIRAEFLRGNECRIRTTVIKLLMVCAFVRDCMYCVTRDLSCTNRCLCEVFTAGFLNQWARGDFAVGHRAIQKIDCLVQKSLVSVISIGELTKIGDSAALTFFLEIKAKIAIPEMKAFFAFVF